MKNEDIDKLFRDHFDKLDIQPSTEVWKKIEAELNEQHIVPIQKKINWLKPLVAIAAIFIGIGAFNLVMQEQAIGPSETKKVVEQKNSDKPIQIQQKEAVDHLIDDKKQSIYFAGKAKSKATQYAQNDNLTASSQPKIAQIEEQIALKKLKIAERQALLVVVDSQAQIAHAMEYIPIKPFIENPEEEESMMASTNTNTQNVVTKMLNILSKTINQGNGPEVQFSKDDEGSLQIDLLNSLVKNKKRKK